MDKLIFTKPCASTDERTHRILLDQETFMKVIDVAERTDLPIWRVLREMVSYAAKNTEVHRQGANIERKPTDDKPAPARFAYSSHRIPDIIERRKDDIPKLSKKALVWLAEQAKQSHDKTRFTLRLNCDAYASVVDLSTKTGRTLSEIASALIAYAVASLEDVENEN